MIYNVRFSHPLVGSKGSAVCLAVNAETKETAIAAAKLNKEFMKNVMSYNTKNYPVEDSYFHAYKARSTVTGCPIYHAGDERL